MNQRRRSLAIIVLTLSGLATPVHGAGHPDPVPSPRGTRTVLGDLSGFRALAVDALRVAQTGDLGAARSRLRDLEEGWERAAPTMKPLAPDQWQRVDAAIDRARRELRFWRARRTDSVEALQAVIDAMDSVG